MKEKNKKNERKSKNIEIKISTRTLLNIILVLIIVFLVFPKNAVNLDLVKGIIQKRQPPLETPFPTFVIPTNIPIPTPTEIPIPTPTTIPLPTATPTPNPVIQNRINQIDNQISNLKKAIKTGIEAGNTINCGGGLACTSTMNQIYANNVFAAQQIQQLEAEKTQLLLQLNK